MQENRYRPWSRLTVSYNEIARRKFYLQVYNSQLAENPNHIAINPSSAQTFFSRLVIGFDSLLGGFF